MNRILDYIFNHFIMVMVLFWIVGIIGTIVMVETVWDGDYRCLVAECRIIKK